ncbi:polysaccharide lyase family 8 super-sandwich domain-containing protein [Specibacter sp. NPDC078709]|uniref:polysaccharide lyase family 8 super-sandwich domain-containing protein n=1 Tax=Specibacter sp. NPDC078709 TaxID=3154364 RepID=UPI00343214E8
MILVADNGIWATLTARWKDLLTGPDGGAFTSTLALHRFDDSVSQILTTKAELLLEVGRRQTGSESWRLAKIAKLLSLASVTDNSIYFESKEARRLAISLVTGLVDNSYFEGMNAEGNWWEWTIGIPQRLTDCLLLIEADFSQDLRDRTISAILYNIPDPRINRWARTNGNRVMTSANLVDQSYSLIGIAILRNSYADMTSMIDVVEQTMKLVRAGEGLYRDGSFIFHRNVPYNGTYGAAAFHVMSITWRLVHGTEFKMASEAHLYLDFFAEHGLAPLLADGGFLPMVCGRAMGREGIIVDTLGTLSDLIGFGMSLHQGVGTWLLDLWFRAGKWAQDSLTRVPCNCDAMTSVSSWFNLADEALLTSFELPTASNRMTWYSTMLRGIYRSRFGWSAGFALSDCNVSYFENGAGENLNGYHSGNGALFVQVPSALTDSSSRYWATIAADRVPGTSVDISGSFDAGRPWDNLAPSNSWAGGAVAENGVNCLSQDVRGYQSSLRISKSWNVSESSIVCVGYIIDSGFGEVRTTIHTFRDRQRRDFSVSSEGSIFLDGWGWICPLDGSLDVDESSSTVDGVNWYWLTVYMNHKDARRSFSYSIIPLSDSQEEKMNNLSQDYFKNPVVLQNDNSAQIVSLGKECFTAAIRSAGKYFLSESNYIDVSKACIVVIQCSEGESSLTVCDPEDGQGRIDIGLSYSNIDSPSHPLYSNLSLENVGRNSQTLLLN